MGQNTNDDRGISENRYWKLTLRLPNKYRRALADASNDEGESFNTIVKNAIKDHLIEEYGIKVKGRGA